MKQFLNLCSRNVRSISSSGSALKLFPNHLRCLSSRATGQDEESKWTWQRKLLLVFFGATAAVTTHLGVWQVQRRQWKIDIINHRQSRLEEPVLDLEELLEIAADDDDLSEYEFRRVFAKGTLDYKNQWPLGPRSPPSTADPRLIPASGGGSFMFTPMTLENGRKLIVNRGWVQRSLLENDVVERLTDENDGTVKFIGILRPGEERPKHLFKEQDPPKDGTFAWLDLPLMTYLAGINCQDVIGKCTTNYYLDVNEPINRRSHPIRREIAEYTNFYTTPEVHAIYAGTWFTLTSVILASCYFLFFKKKPNLKPLASQIRSRARVIQQQQQQQQQQRRQQ